MNNKTTKTPINTVRLDKWLWAARFYKTRQLALKAIKNKQVSAQSGCLKPASMVRVDDLLYIKRGLYRQEIIVVALSESRASATIAQRLYRETAASIEARAELKQGLASQAKLIVNRRKPDKRSLRENRRIKRGER